MLDLDQISNTIEELENGATTFDNCLKLASLYIVKDHLNNAVERMSNSITPAAGDQVETELADILPHYRKYCEVKREWQLQGVDRHHVIQEMEFVCKEVIEFVQSLYSCTSMPEERVPIKEMSSFLYKAFSA